MTTEKEIKADYSKLICSFGLSDASASKTALPTPVAAPVKVPEKQPKIEAPKTDKSPRRK